MSTAEWLAGFTILVQVGVLVVVMRRQSPTGAGQHAAALLSGQERLERSIREEWGLAREEALRAAQHTQETLFTQIGEFGKQTAITSEQLTRTLQDTLGQTRSEAAHTAQRTREELLTQVQALGKQTSTGVEQLTQSLTEALRQGRQEATQTALQARQELATQFQGLREEVNATLGSQYQQQGTRWDSFTQGTRDLLEGHDRRTVTRIAEMAEQQKGALDSFNQQLIGLTQMNDTKLERMRATVEQRLLVLQEDNSKKLDEMRTIVDEKLHQTLEQRLGESFKLVSERLELVHKGLGEMQTLASGVGDLKKVLSNVKTRGTLGEIQLENLLEQMLSPEQYRVQVQVHPGSGERVDYAVVLPGRTETAGSEVLFPIDSKFPLEDYQRLVDAEEAGDAPQAAQLARLLEGRVKEEAKRIRDKYVNPPFTTDFALLFLPLEGLYAEVLRRPGLWELLQREYHVVVTGPTTLSALLSAFQMGFRTLAIQKRSSEVWTILGAVKTEFGKFGDVLDKTQKKLREASDTLDKAATRTRAIERRLRQVEAVPAIEAPAVLGDLELALPDSG